MSRIAVNRLVEHESAAYITGLPHRITPFSEELTLTTNKGKLPPTAILLHGRHGDERVPWIFARTIPKHWTLVAPRGIEFEPETPKHETGYSWMTMPEAGWPTWDAFDDGVEALHEFILGLDQVYPIDMTRLYLLGFSQGGALAINWAVRYPELVKGVALLVGFSPEPELELNIDNRLEELPVFMAVGQKDERIPLHIAHQTRNMLARLGASLTYEEYDTGHKLNSAGMRDLTDWWHRFEQ